MPKRLSIRLRDPFVPDFAVGQRLSAGSLSGVFVKWNHRLKKVVIRCDGDSEERSFHLDQVKGAEVMGSRGNIVVRFPRGDIVFYTHYRGHEVKKVVAQALAKRERWDDYPYLARIIFTTLIGKDDSTTGFGISFGICANSYPIVVVDMEKRQAFLADEELRIDGPIYSYDDWIKHYQ